jgi:hypothetical protein
VPGDVFDRERPNQMGCGDQCQNEEYSQNSFASHIELHRFESRVGPRNCGSRPLPQSFRVISHESFENIITTADTALAFQQAQFISISPK